MEELFQRLESRIQNLLQKTAHIKVSNQSMQQDSSLLAEENERLLTKHKSVVTQIENMVTRLKALEGL